MSIDNHGIRMDVFTMEVDTIADANEITYVYDIEPNDYKDSNIARRNRYYQSLIDSKLLPPDTPYSTLPDIFSIWIVSYDPFEDDRMIYTVKNMAAGNNQIVYNDGVTNMFLYTKGTKGGSRKLKEFLTFMENPICDNAVDDELLKILNIVDTVKGNAKERGRYMGLMGYTDYIIRDGIREGIQAELEKQLEPERERAREEGRAEGLIEGTIKTCKLLKMSREESKEMIISQFSYTEDQAEEYLNLYW